MDQWPMQDSIYHPSRFTLLFEQFVVLAKKPSSICFWIIKQNIKESFKIFIWLLSLSFKTLDKVFNLYRHLLFGKNMKVQLLPKLKQFLRYSCEWAMLSLQFIKNLKNSPTISLLEGFSIIFHSYLVLSVE